MSEWILVSDRLPEENQKVIYYFEEVGVHIGRYTKYVDDDGYDHAVFFSHAGWLCDDVTHWMPYPEDPVE